MSTETEPTVRTSTLTPYFGREVTQSKIEVRSVGGGLQDALNVDPVELDHGEERWLAMRVVVSALRFDEIKDSDCLARVHIFKLVDNEIAFLDDDAKLVKGVEQHIATREERIRKAREDAAGIMRLGDGDDGEGAFGHEPGERDADGEKPGDDDQWENT